MNKIVTSANSPYTLDLGNVDTANYANSIVNIQCSGTGLVVNMLPQAQIPGQPDFYLTSVVEGAQINFAEGEGFIDSSGNIQSSATVGGSGGYGGVSHLKPLANGIWYLNAGNK